MMMTFKDAIELTEETVIELILKRKSLSSERRKRPMRYP